MYLCVICKSTFVTLSFSGPSEPCDCGMEIDREAADRLSIAYLNELRRRFASGEPMRDETASQGPDGWR